MESKSDVSTKKGSVWNCTWAFIKQPKSIKFCLSDLIAYTSVAGICKLLPSDSAVLERRASLLGAALIRGSNWRL